VPALALRLMFGEMAEATLLSGQRAIPAKATALGFSFRYPRLDDAFDAIFGAHGSG
jgi:NAD dependent epimerase/dehydratase family enzyme